MVANVEPVKIIIEDRMVGDKPRLRYLPHKVVPDDHLLQHRLRHRELHGVHRRLVNLCPLAGRVRLHLLAVHDVADHRGRRLRDNAIDDERLGDAGTTGLISIGQKEDGVALPEQSATVLQASHDRVHRLGCLADELTTRRDIGDQPRPGDTAGHGTRRRLRLPQLMHDPVVRPSAAEVCKTNHCCNPFSS